LQQRRFRIAAGIHLHGVDGDRGLLDVVAGAADAGHAVVDLGLRRAAVAPPAILGVQTVAEQDDEVIIVVAGDLGGRRQRSAAHERLPAPDEADRLVGGSVRGQPVDEGLHRAPVVGEAAHRAGAGDVILIGRPFRVGRGAGLVVLLVDAGRGRGGRAGDGATVHDAAGPGRVVVDDPGVLPAVLRARLGRPGAGAGAIALGAAARCRAGLVPDRAPDAVVAAVVVAQAARRIDRPIVHAGTDVARIGAAG